MPKTLDPIDLAEARARRLAMIVDGYEVGDEGMPDATVPGAAICDYIRLLNTPDVLRKHPRFVLVTQYGDHGNYRLYLAKDLANIEQLAADALSNPYGGELVICYFDLDELAGQPPRPCEGDRVKLTEEGRERVGFDRGENAFWVIGTETDTFDGVAFERLYLGETLDADYLSGAYAACIDEQYVEVIESAYPDERMPVRYGLAKTVVSVAFNTVPSP